jgi:hypothetical protein
MSTSRLTHDRKVIFVVPRALKRFADASSQCAADVIALLSNRITGPSRCTVAYIPYVFAPNASSRATNANLALAPDFAAGALAHASLKRS